RGKLRSSARETTQGHPLRRATALQNDPRQSSTRNGVHETTWHQSWGPVHRNWYHPPNPQPACVSDRGVPLSFLSSRFGKFFRRFWGGRVLIKRAVSEHGVER